MSKIPFNYQLGLITGDSLFLNLCLLPAVVAGVLAGRWLLGIIPQAGFQQLLLIFALLASLRLLWG